MKHAPVSAPGGPESRGVEGNGTNGTQMVPTMQPILIPWCAGSSRHERSGGKAGRNRDGYGKHWVKFDVDPKTVCIRAAEPGDVDQVHQMQVQWAEEEITYGYGADSRENLLGKLGPYFLVAELDGSLVGHAYGSPQVSEGLAVIPAGERYLEIEDIYVIPEIRSRSIGGLLLDRLLQAAGEEGIETFSVYSSTKDADRILRFYRGHGFESWYVQLFRR